MNNVTCKNLFEELGSDVSEDITIYLARKPENKIYTLDQTISWIDWGGGEYARSSREKCGLAYCLKKPQSFMIVSWPNGIWEKGNWYILAYCLLL